METKTRAVYAGSFDPFTNGHLSIAESAARIFDELHIVIAVNSSKLSRRTDADLMAELVGKAVEAHDNIYVALTDAMIADYCKNIGAQYLVRGLRNPSDFVHEENIANTNLEVNPNLETVYLRAINGVISSSMVWELFIYGKPVEKYIPYPESALLEQ